MARILLVEDDKFTRELYEMLLKEAGHEVEAIEDGGVGFSKAAKGNYDLILLDIMLPTKDGLSILKSLKQLPEKKNQKIVMLTVLNQDQFIKEALRAGADGYLMKSALNPDDILAEVEAFLKSESNLAQPK